MPKISTALKKLTDPQLFAVCYIPWLAVNMLANVNPLAFTRYVLAFFAVWGLAIAVRQYFFSGKAPYTKKFMPVLIVFLSICLVTSLIQFKYGGFSRIGRLSYFALCILVLYPIPNSSSADYKKHLTILSRVLGIVILLILAVSLWMFITLYSTTVITRSGDEVKIGFSANRLTGVFSSPNVGATYAIILIWTSIISFCSKGRGMVFWRVLSVIQVIVSLTFISLSLSRGGIFTVYFFVAVAVFLHTPFRFEKNMPNNIQFLNRVVCVAVTLTVLWGSMNVMHDTATKAMQSVQQRTASQDGSKSVEQTKTELQQIVDTVEQGMLGRNDVTESTLYNAGRRVKIWKTHLSALRGTKLFTGINDAITYYYESLSDGATFSQNDAYYFEWARGNMHNGYVQMAVNHGILAFAAFLVFLILCATKCFKHMGLKIFKHESTDYSSNMVFALCMPLVAALLVNNFIETNIVLMGTNFFQALFWYCAGAAAQSTFDH